MKAKKLTPKQTRFVEEYLIDLNASAAAERAGYSPKTARIIGCQNLTKLNVQTALREAKEKLQTKRESVDDLNHQWVIDRLKIMARRSLQEVEILDKKGNPTGVWKYDSFGAGKALELLGKYLRMFGDGAEAQAAINAFLQAVLTLLQSAPPDFRDYAVSELRKYQTGLGEQVRSGRA